MNRLLFWLLQRLAANPEALFWELDLREGFPDEFCEAEQAGLLRRARAVGEGELYNRLAGPSLTIVAEGDSFIGIAEDDPDHIPVPLSELDLQRSQLNVAGFLEWFKARNDIKGGCQELHRGFFQLGERNQGREAVFLGLFLPISRHVELVSTLPAALNKPFARCLLVSPLGSFGQPQSKLLRARGITVVPLDEELLLTAEEFEAPDLAAIKLPTRKANQAQWRAIWSLVQPLVEEGELPDQISVWLQNHHPDVAPSKRTLGKILLAGHKGHLSK